MAAWAVVGAMGALRFLGRLRGKKAARWSVIGFTAISLAYLLLLILSHEGARFL
jgi:ABC-type uncharacterized transport system permease subunit